MLNLKSDDTEDQLFLRMGDYLEPNIQCYLRKLLNDKSC